MNNSSNATTNMVLSKSLLKTHYTHILIFLAFMVNMLTFIILCRPSHGAPYARPTLHYTHSMIVFSLLLLNRSCF